MGGNTFSRFETDTETTIFTKDENLSINELLSKTEDIDIAQKVMEFKMAENVYTASLQTGAKILQPSLLDFLR